MAPRRHFPKGYLLRPVRGAEWHLPLAAISRRELRHDGVVDRNHSTGRGGYIPSLGEIRNCHINVGTGKELTIRELSEPVVKAVAK